MREYIGKLREKRDRVQRFEEETITIEFESWLSQLSKEKQIEFVPENQFTKPGGVAHRASLKQYFLENIWPTKHKNITENHTMDVTEVSGFRDSEKK